MSVKLRAPIIALSLALSTSTALAGGFERSGLPLGFMFENGSYAELSFGYASPEISGAAGGGLAPSGNMAEDYSTIGLSFKTDLTEKLSLNL